MALLSRRFKSEFQVIGVLQQTDCCKTYQCISKVDQQSYSVSKRNFSTTLERASFFKILKSFSNIYHKNVLRYYNTWSQPSKSRSCSRNSSNTSSFSLENDVISPANLMTNSLNFTEFVDNSESSPRFYFQIESHSRSLFEFCSELRRKSLAARNEEGFLRNLLGIYEQLLRGIQELFSHDLRQKNLMDFNNIFLGNYDDVKLGNLQDLELNTHLCEREFATLVLRDIESITYKLFFEENPFFKTGSSGMNRKNSETMKKIEEFFLKKIKERNWDEIIRNINAFFLEMLHFVKFMLLKKEEEVLGVFEYKQENGSLWNQKFLTICMAEVRCYKDKRDQKPEKIFNLKNFDTCMEEIDNGIISLKNPLQLGCFLRGNNRKETDLMFKRFSTIRSKQ